MVLWCAARRSARYRLLPYGTLGILPRHRTEFLCFLGDGALGAALWYDADLRAASVGVGCGALGRRSEIGAVPAGTALYRP